MESLIDQYGHEDSLFVSDVPDYLHCIICTLVLRDPVQILQCGHKYCHVCFERIKEQAVRTGVDLLCPIDREIVDLNAVHPDLGMGRIVGNLPVRCREHENGCNWNGDLRELDAHREQCKHRIRSESSAATVTEDVVRRLIERLDRCEIALQEKDKQIASLEFKLQEQEQQMQQQRQEQKRELQQEKQQLQQHLQQQKQQQEEHQLLLNQNKLLQEEVSQLRGNCQLLESRTKQLSDEMDLLQKRITSGPYAREVMPEGVSPIPVKVLNSNKSKVSKRTTVEPKKIVIQHHSGQRNSITISDNYHRVEFKLWSTVSSPSAVVPLGAKVWYEVRYLPGVIGCHQVGWATNNLQTSEKRLNIGVGDENDSYGFNPFDGEKWYGGKTTWGKKLEPNDGGYVGVALDTVEGEVWYSTNGDWSAPNGIAFNGIDTNTQFFPALSGSKAMLEVNFGDRAFCYGPPTSDFLKLIDVL